MGIYFIVNITYLILVAMDNFRYLCAVPIASLDLIYCIYILFDLISHIEKKSTVNIRSWYILIADFSRLQGF